MLCVENFQKHSIYLHEPTAVAEFLVTFFFCRRRLTPLITMINYLEGVWMSWVGVCVVIAVIPHTHTHTQLTDLCQ